VPLGPKTVYLVVMTAFARVCPLDRNRRALGLLFPRREAGRGLEILDPGVLYAFLGLGWLSVPPLCCAGRPSYGLICEGGHERDRPLCSFGPFASTESSAWAA